MKKTTRRLFLQSSALAVPAVIGAAGALSTATGAAAAHGDEQRDSKATYQFSRELPIEEGFDLVVAGGGPAGVAAAVCAARLGAKVVLLEAMGCLGGMGTSGLVTAFDPMANGERMLVGGLMKEIVTTMHRRGFLGPHVRPDFYSKRFHCWTPFKAEGYKLVLDELVKASGVEVRFFTRAIDADVDAERHAVRGVIVNNVEGMRYLRAKTFVDATGDAVLAHVCGVPCREAGRDTPNIMPPTLCSLYGGIDWERGIMFATTILTAALLLPTAENALMQVPAGGRVIPSESRAQDGDPRQTAPGDLYVEPSTLHSLGFEWDICGDENRNGSVSVQYREAGQTAWKQGMDLLRINGERVGRKSKSPRDDPTWEYVCGNLYAGSILFLEPGTEYEVRLTMTDPDNRSNGVVEEKRLVVATKCEPKTFARGRRLHVYPSNHEGEKIQPAFDSFTAAYKEAEAGDQLLLHAGRYSGSYTLDKSGTRERPIVIRDASDGPVVFQGNPDADKITREPIKGTDRFHWHENVALFDVSSANHHWFQGLTIRNYEYGIHSGDRGTTRGLTVRYCRFEDCGWSGILIRSSECRDIYIADNVFRGTQGTWFRSEQKPFPYKGVWVNGQGVDVCYNLAQNHKDGISIFGKVADRSVFEKKVAAIDFYNNDVGQSWDDNEADGGQHNIRFFCNRLVDQHVGLSAQPIYGGPCYFIRNVQYNITRGVPFKTNVQPAGVLIYNNTSVSCGMIHGKGVATITAGYSNSRIFNNLFLGLTSPTLNSGFFDPGISQIDYNGYTVVGPIEWTTFDERWMPKRRLSFQTLEEFADSTGCERHAVAVGFEDLANVPDPPCETKTHTDLNFGDARPKSRSRAVDAGVVIPNVTDGFSGRAPDLGAYEFGHAMPHYGPRQR